MDEIWHHTLQIHSHYLHATGNHKFLELQKIARQAHPHKAKPSKGKEAKSVGRWNMYDIIPNTHITYMPQATIIVLAIVYAIATKPSTRV